MKDPFDFRQAFVKIEMFRLDIQNQDMFGMKTTDGAVALVPFGHKKFTTRIPVRVLSEDRNLRADVMRRVQPALAQDMRGHGRGGGFAIHAAAVVYFSIVSTTAVAAFLVESLAAFCDIRSRRP